MSKPTPEIPVAAYAQTMLGAEFEELEAGTLLDERYRVVRRIGAGGMGVVYQAEHVGLEKAVAIKVLTTRFAHEPDLARRFQQEARAASSIRHENIVDVTDIGRTPTGAFYFVMEYLKGRSIGEHVRDSGPFLAARVRHIGLQLCRALEATHARDIVHRDLKSDNVLLVERDERADFAKILDFGVAKVTVEAAERMTRTGTLIGTPEYMAPEQIASDNADQRVDIYSLGCILYEMLTGTLPFVAPTVAALLRMHLFDAPEAPSKRVPHLRIPAALDAVVLRALAKDPKDRYQTMRAFHEALESMGAATPAPTPPRLSTHTQKQIAAVRSAVDQQRWEEAAASAEPVLLRHAGRTADPQLHAMLEPVYEKLCSPLTRVVHVKDQSRTHDARAGFLVSRVDGTLTLEDLLDVSGMPRVEALRLLARLMRDGVIVAK